MQRYSSYGFETHAYKLADESPERSDDILNAYEDTLTMQAELLGPDEFWTVKNWKLAYSLFHGQIDSK